MFYLDVCEIFTLVVSTGIWCDAFIVETQLVHIASVDHHLFEATGMKDAETLERRLRWVGDTTTKLIPGARNLASN